MVSEAFILIQQGRIIEAALSVYTELMGWWWLVLIFATFEMMIFMKTESTTPPLVVALVFSGLIMGLAPAGATGITELVNVMSVIFGITLVGIVYKIYKSQR